MAHILNQMYIIYILNKNVVIHRSMALIGATAYTLSDSKKDILLRKPFNKYNKTLRYFNKNIQGPTL